MNLPLHLKYERLELKPIQEEMIDVIREAVKKHRHVVLMAGTGLGKTILATYMFKKAAYHGKRCLFICDRRILVEQTSREFDRFGIDHGVIMADHPRFFLDRLVHIASAQTLEKRGVGNYDFIIIDECHHLRKSHKQIIRENPNAIIIGLSATPFTKGMGKYFATHIEPYTVRQLIQKGYLCDFEIYGPEIYDLSSVSTVAGEYHQGQLEEAVDQKHLIGEVVDTYQKLGRGRKTVCFTQSIAHGKHLAQEFNRHGIKAVEVNAYQPDALKHQNINSFKDGLYEVICSVEMLTKGFDCSAVNCVLWATATKSPMKWIQATGRGLRVSPGKDLCRVIDHGGNCARLGFPDEFCFGALDEGKEKKSDTDQREKERIEKLPKRCPSCDFLKPAGMRKCPACGLVPEFMEAAETVDGKLVRLSRGEKKGITPTEKKKWFAMIMWEGNRLGYKSGWAAHTFKKKFGHWPHKKYGVKPVKPNEDVLKYIRHLKVKYLKAKEAV